MTELYTSVLIVECLALAILGVMVWHNQQLSRNEKLRFTLTYIVLSLSAIFEWLAIYLNGSDASLRWLHIAAKCLDYTLTPAVAFFFVRQVAQLKRIEPFFLVLLGLNMILQIVSCFTKWTFYIDDSGVYQHGILHPIYIAVYVLAICYVVLGFVVYAKRFPRQNLVPFLLLVALAVGGILVQEFFGDKLSGKIRIGTLCLVFSTILLYIHYVSFAQQQKDLDLAGKDKLLRSDSLSGCLSRFAYNQAYNSLASKPLSSDFAVMYIDLNGLKQINDKYGHEAGDEYIKCASSILLSTLHGKGECFRTGGDEFLVFLHSTEEEIKGLSALCQAKAAEWKGIENESMSLAIGYATVADSNETNLDKLVSLADAKMYEEKKRYYEEHGLKIRR